MSDIHEDVHMLDPGSLNKRLREKACEDDGSGVSPTAKKVKIDLDTAGFGFAAGASKASAAFAAELSPDRRNPRLAPVQNSCPLRGPKKPTTIQNKHTQKKTFTQMSKCFAKTHKTRPTEAPQIYKQREEKIHIIYFKQT